MHSIRKLLIVFALPWIAICFTDAETSAQVTVEPRSATPRLVMKWLGTAGWEIQIGETIILVDPFLTRKEPDRVGGEWKTDEEAVLKAISGADYIFAGHSHADHIADIPFIARKFGSKVVGSQTTTNLALTGGVEKSQLTTISGGEKLVFKEFSVQVIESEHGTRMRGGRRRQLRFEEITKPWSGPILGTSFVAGASYLYYFDFGKHRLLHQSTGGFIAAKLGGLRPTIAQLYPMGRNDLAELLKVLQPKTVFIHHFDNWRAPFAAGLAEPNLRRARRVTRDIAAIDSQINVITPKFFASHVLE
jgi:L-ascorbate metabolism protein UlaG (beta-lactamase superfamily)